MRRACKPGAVFSCAQLFLRRTIIASRLQRPGAMANIRLKAPKIDTLLKNWLCCARNCAGSAKLQKRCAVKVATGMNANIRLQA